MLLKCVTWERKCAGVSGDFHLTHEQMVSKNIGISHLNLSSTSEKSYVLSENYDIVYYGIYFVKWKKYIMFVSIHTPTYIYGFEFFTMEISWAFSFSSVKWEHIPILQNKQCVRNI